jgi:hypothetical protein
MGIPLQETHVQKGNYLTIAKPEPVSNTNTSGHTIYSNETITRLDHDPTIENSGLSPNSKDAKKSCSSSFRSVETFSTGCGTIKRVSKF